MPGTKSSTPTVSASTSLHFSKAISTLPRRPSLAYARLETSLRTSRCAIRSFSNTSCLGFASLGNTASPPNKAPTMLSILPSAVSWSPISKNASLPLLHSADT
ncbi:hypothetical protein M427DRAFT_139127 [Gonapodya prolifera JEL478]|uniref:Uncharacterized protein n=1 Tax=Gonapodya prolifera (strain JEL478) TaxID=1344416 RepID=A0A139A1Y2_GONPJ|nr:hypothetical protein M427DRAFT_139127 [Gonapodya prolifera JEL478]|eukprot:KXS10648.1 hypothetical protein M427DRAFT_139127 [Gonapodya prolifera JEL478]